MLTICLTEAEAEAIIIQISARLDDLREIQVQEGKRGNIDRVLELEKFMEPIKSGKKKLEDALY